MSGALQGATEWVLNDCKHLTGADGSMQPLTDAIRKNINDHVLNMADRGAQAAGLIILTGGTSGLFRADT